MSKTRILESVRQLDVESTRSLLRADPSLLLVTDRQGRNLLHLASSAACTDLGIAPARSVRLVNLLLDLGLDVDSALVDDGYPCNAVWFAVARGRNHALVKLLIKRGATPRGLFAAGWFEDLALLKTLIAAGAAVDETAEGETPFLHCWKNRKFKAARLLVASGADVNFRDSKGKTALHYGVEKEFEPSLLKFLIRSGASPDIEDGQGVSARARAARKREPSFLKALSP